MTKKTSNFLQKFRNGYRIVAYTLLNTLVAIVLLVILISTVSFLKESSSKNPVSAKYGDISVNAIYPGLSESEINAFLNETWSRTYSYEPFTQFKEKPYSGRYVNVHNQGFRITKQQGPWPPGPERLNIFLFGGSTTFGYGVPDDETIASYLQEYLTSRLKRDVRIYNFGRGHYYSTQERILFEKLLVSGVVPDIAIFIDGLNDFYYNTNEPKFTKRLSEFVEQGSSTNKIKDLISGLSQDRSSKETSPPPSDTLPENPDNAADNQPDNFGQEGDKYNDTKVINFVITRYLANKKLIEAASLAFNVKPIFVWQPVPTYNYDQEYHPFSMGGYGKHTYSRYGYERMEELTRQEPPGDNFFWCANIFTDEKTPFYADKVHYSALGSKRLATSIGDLLLERYSVDLAIQAPDSARH